MDILGALFFVFLTAGINLVLYKLRTKKTFEKKEQYYHLSSINGSGIVETTPNIDRYCSKCGEVRGPGDVFCGACGSHL